MARLGKSVEQHNIHTHTHTRLTALFPGLPGWAGTRKVKPVWILLKQETVSGSGSGISWAICKSASRSRQITMPVPHHSVFYRPDALPAAQPTASKHWRQKSTEGNYRTITEQINKIACIIQAEVTDKRSKTVYDKNNTEQNHQPSTRKNQYEKNANKIHLFFVTILENTSKIWNIKKGGRVKKAHN